MKDEADKRTGEMWPSDFLMFIGESFYTKETFCEEAARTAKREARKAAEAAGKEGGEPAADAAA